MHSVELDRRRVQTVKLTLTIVAANFLLWTPFCITSVVDALWPQAISEWHLLTFNITHYMLSEPEKIKKTYINNIINRFRHQTLMIKA